MRPHRDIISNLQNELALRVPVLNRVPRLRAGRQCNIGGAQLRGFSLLHKASWLKRDEEKHALHQG